MLISLGWIRDFVDLPEGLDAHKVAERFTVTTAEVEGVRRIDVAARGLIVARVESAYAIPDTRNLRLVTLEIGKGQTIETVSTVATLPERANVLYAPPGASTNATGRVDTAEIAGKSSAGMIVPGEAVGVPMAEQEAVFLSDEMAPGEVLSADLFDDWLIEVDNKSITHRPDLWGHYGIAREMAAIFNRPLKPYPVVALDELSEASLPEVPIVIADADACRRYSCLVLTAVPTRPAPLWMQLRLGHIGLRPISGLVDLTNYIMADLGQPMHAFDAALATRIEVAWAEEGERFRALDGVERELSDSALMIQCDGKSIAIAGVMGGLESEVSERTTSLLLESANFDPVVVRRTAARLGVRTDASARFEKSLDPANTVLAIRRFIHLARTIYPTMSVSARLSDRYPKPADSNTINIDPRHVSRTMGRDVPTGEARDILHRLGFELRDRDGAWEVTVPSYRAAPDVTIEADVIEEIARYIGYATIEPAMPRVSMRRFEPHALHELEQRTLEFFTTRHRFHEVQGYLWYDRKWLSELGIEPGPCATLRNPSAEGLHLLRRSMMPGLLASVARNRFHFPAFSLVEIGSVIEPSGDGDQEFRHVGLVVAHRGRKEEERIHANLKGAIEEWAWRRMAAQVRFSPTAKTALHPWSHASRTSTVNVKDMAIGHVSVIDMALRQAMDEHLGAWSIAWAELRLDELARAARNTERLGMIPQHPRVEMDFSFLVPASTRYADVVAHLAAFDHQLLKQVRHVGSYQGKSIEGDRRSLTFRVVAGDDSRTLVDDDTNELAGAFTRHLAACGYELRERRAGGPQGKCL